jgi:hypothetical protein
MPATPIPLAKARVLGPGLPRDAHGPFVSWRDDAPDVGPFCASATCLLRDKDQGRIKPGHYYRVRGLSMFHLNCTPAPFTPFNGGV